MIDSHSHFNLKTLTNLKKEIVLVNKTNSLKKIINVGLDYDTSREAIEISLDEPKFYATIGIHPLYNGEVKDLLNLYNKYDCSKVIAVGEIGLDSNKDIKLQIDKFIEQIYLANYLGLPIVIHSNNTNKEVLEIIKKHRPIYGFVFHCFQPDIDIARQILDLNGYMSFGTKILKPNAKKSLEVISYIPIENLLIETDYPFLSENHISDLIDIFNKVLDITNMEYKQLEEQIDINNKRLFKKL